MKSPELKQVSSTNAHQDREKMADENYYPGMSFTPEQKAFIKRYEAFIPGDPVDKNNDLDLVFRVRATVESGGYLKGLNEEQIKKAQYECSVLFPEDSIQRLTESIGKFEEIIATSSDDTEKHYMRRGMLGRYERLLELTQQKIKEINNAEVDSGSERFLQRHRNNVMKNAGKTPSLRQETVSGVGVRRVLDTLFSLEKAANIKLPGGRTAEEFLSLKGIEILHYGKELLNDEKYWDSLPEILAVEFGDPLRKSTLKVILSDALDESGV
jgi:hypothetical protein